MLDQGLFDYAICVDGPYPGFEGWPHQQESTDGTREIIQCYRNTKLYTLAAQEYFKRELACHISRSLGCGFLLIIDGDEYLINQDIDRFRNCLQRIVNSTDQDRNIWPIKVRYPRKANYFIGTPRLWYKPWEVEYLKGSHWRFKNMYHSRYYDKTTMQENWVDLPFIEGIAMVHDSLSRAEERQTLRNEYAPILEAYENSINFNE